MFSIIIPTLNNLKYLKTCIESIKKNSFFDHEIVIHVNIGNDGTLDYLKSNNIKFTHSKINLGVCKAMNIAAQTTTKEYILYAHDDFYFTPNWDEILNDEIIKLGHNNFYLSGTMINNGQIKFDCGDTIEQFDETKFLQNYKEYNHYDFQGSTWAPHLIHKDVWNKVGGFSEEFFPGIGSDPDLCMKLWKIGIRIFKGINDFKVYHFGSITSRKYDDPKIKSETGSKSSKIFLLKWGCSINFFKKFIIKSDTIFNGELDDPKKNFRYYIHLTIDKFYYFYIKFIYNFRNNKNLLSQ